MKNKLPMILIVGFTAVIIGVLAWLSSMQPSTAVPQNQQTQKPAIKVGQTAPNFTLKDLNNKSYSLSQYKAKEVVFLELFAVWCPHCQAEAPRIDSLYNQYKGKDVQFLNVQASPYGKNYETAQDTSAATIDDLNYFKNTFHVSYPILQDRNVTTATNYGLTSYPTFYVIDKSGKVSYTSTGEVDPSELASAIDKVL